MTGNQDLNVQSDPDTLCFLGHPIKNTVIKILVSYITDTYNYIYVNGSRSCPRFASKFSYLMVSPQPQTNMM